MSRSEVKVEGLDTVRENLRKLSRQYPKSAKGALYRFAERLMTDSKRECPVDKGHLRASGHVVPDPDLIEVTLGFGGPAGVGNQGETNREDTSGYAVVQHEELGYTHDVGKAKYLEDPVMRGASTMLHVVGSDIQEDIDKGVAS